MTCSTLYAGSLSVTQWHLWLHWLLLFLQYPLRRVVVCNLFADDTTLRINCLQYPLRRVVVCNYILLMVIHSRL